MLIQYIPWLALLLAIASFATTFFLFKKVAKKNRSLEILVKSLLAQQESNKSSLLKFTLGRLV
ncbi:hypothetical protein [Psychromonas sp. KJ10-2]|uniref:hypothetical protein n=1 Tax=Psychromonas sp. KJ10-2 TaxID=3391822 RepID=UPI0039B45FEE